MQRSGQTLLRLVAVAAAALFSFGSLSVAHAEDRYAAYVMDARTNEVLLDEASSEPRFPASLTKMMTLYMVFEALERGEITMDTRMTASRAASRMPPSRLGVRRGDTLTIEQGIRSLVVQSANDVAVMIAERLGGTESRFAANMTARAREMGLTDTRFVNASGLPDARQRTTAHDMAILSQAIWRDYPEHYHYFQTANFSWRNRSGRNHNHLLGRVEGVDGIKTGYTRASGFNLASMAERNGRRVIVVVMGGESASARDAQVAHLIEGAFEEYARRDDGVTYANMPVQRLDGMAPNLSAQGVTVATTNQTSPYTRYYSANSAPEGTVVQTLAPVRGPLDALRSGQGDQADPADQSTEEETE